MVILWMALIFTFSHQPRENSNKLSTGITERIAKVVENLTPNKDINIRSFNHILRKNAHFFIYLILGILVPNGLVYSGVNKSKIIILSLAICLAYAISDEVHQLFVPGRGGQIKDVITDTPGATVGIGLYIKIRFLHTA